MRGGGLYEGVTEENGFNKPNFDYYIKYTGNG